MSDQKKVVADSPVRRLAHSTVPRLAVWLVLIVTVTLVAIAAAIFLSNRNQREITQLTTEQFNQQQLILACSAAAGIEYFVADVDADLLTLSSIPAVQRMEADTLDAMADAYVGLQSLSGKIIQQL